MPRSIFVKESNISGKGVLAKRDFKKGDIVFILKGKVKPWVVKDKLTSAVGPNWIGIKSGIWIDPAYPYMYLNHSCDPNIGIKGKVVFRALRNIKKGEELVFDYSTTEDDLFWRLPYRCGCGTKKCRKVIKSIQFLTKEEFKSRLPYVPNYFQRVYTKFHSATQK